MRLQQPGLLTQGRGSIGWNRPNRGTLVFDFEADSLSVLDSLATWLAGRTLTGGPTPEALRGSAKGRLTPEGALDSITVGAQAPVAGLRWRGWHMAEGGGPVPFPAGPG